MKKLFLLLSICFSSVSIADQTHVTDGRQLLMIVKNNFRSSVKCALAAKPVKVGINGIGYQIAMLNQTNRSQKSFLLKNFTDQNIRSIYERGQKLQTYTYELTSNTSNSLVKNHFVLNLVANVNHVLVTVSVRNETSMYRPSQGWTRKVSEVLFNCSL